MDHPKLLPEPPVVHREKLTIHDGPADRPTRHGLSGTLVRTVHKLHAPKIYRQNGSEKGAKELARTRRTTRLSGTLLMVYIRIKLQVDLEADKSSVGVKRLFFPQV
jgi:hypothetical protein